jgi:hypothetical protein
MLALRKLAREDGDGGFHAPASASEESAALEAWEQLRIAEDRLGDRPVIVTYRAIAATLACKLDDADAALRLARRDGEARETLLTAQEVRLRRGQVEDVKAFGEKMSAVPSVSGDPWLKALRASVTAPPRCPLGPW